MEINIGELSKLTVIDFRALSFSVAIGVFNHETESAIFSVWRQAEGVESLSDIRVPNAEL